MTKQTFHGKDVVLKIGTASNVLAASRGLSLDITADTLDTTTRGDAQAGYTTHKQSWKTWTVSVDGLYVANEAAKNTLDEYFDSGNEMPIRIELPNGTTHEGNVIITSFPLDFPYDESVTFSCECQGTGPLIKVNVVSAAKANKVKKAKPNSIEDGLNKITDQGANNNENN